MENGIKTLPREPWRGSQICGEQMYDGNASSAAAYCATRKGDKLPMCEEHFDAMIAEYGTVTVPPDVALGAPHLAVRLLWEGDDPTIPIEPSYEEMAGVGGAQ